MTTFPVPSWRTTREMAHYLRPVQMILWAANPPGSRAFTYLSRLRPSRSSPDTAAPPPTAAAAAKEEEATIAKGGFTRSDEAVRGHRIRKKHKVLGLEETLEEKATKKKDKDDGHVNQMQSGATLVYIYSLYSILPYTSVGANANVERHLSFFPPSPISHPYSLFCHFAFCVSVALHLHSH
ncbi:hypothetical protein B296_00006772 [Ensete ventricosum]|uniref:Uncharacterized protein n=1 Tax=Ensete ventricosum TaxID=4639 RepID=A0A427ALJ6_ENSVE|nr:hypothetical protein B296_00006772 [Ensete ventricosum]